MTKDQLTRKFLAGPFQSQRALTVRILTNPPTTASVGVALKLAAERAQS